VILVELLSFEFNGLSKIRNECSYCDIGGIVVFCVQWLSKIRGECSYCDICGIVVYHFLNILFIISNSM
jgi:hypothetical protein